jgi:hypothetical protein
MATQWLELLALTEFANNVPTLFGYWLTHMLILNWLSEGIGTVPVVN